MNRKYFGTDGIRGLVGASPINAEFVLKLGWAAGKVLSAKKNGLVLIGKDTRTSGYMFESALQAGLSAAGVNIGLTGPIPTPGLAYLTRTFRAQAGIVISASHNAYTDNGIKFFSPEGKKLPDEIEASIEALLSQQMTTVDPARLGKATRLDDAAPRYIEFCKSTIPLGSSFQQFKIVIDCANGATYNVAPKVFRELGAKVITLGCQPDGVNINRGSGSTHPERLQAKVIELAADLGIAFDGDGDRAIFIDHMGEVVDGDELLYVISRWRLYQGVGLKTVVGTVMSNMGLEVALNNLGLQLVKGPVGDRYVLELMEEHHSLLGGETCGHIICLDKTITGDGIVTALQVIEALIQLNTNLHAIKSEMRKLPQMLINVPSPYINDLEVNHSIELAARKIQRNLGKLGRVVVRPSGTEPVFRIMVEGEDDELVTQKAKQLGETILQISERSDARYQKGNKVVCEV